MQALIRPAGLARDRARRPAPGGRLPRPLACEPARRRPARGATTAPAPEEAAALFRRLDEKIIAGMARHAIPGAAVAVHCRGHEHVRGFGVADVRRPFPVDGDTLFRIGSTSKTFTGTAAMRLVDAGLLDLDAPVRLCLPDFQAPRGARDVTMRQVLNHTAGWLGESYTDTGRGPDALGSYVARMRWLPLLTRPGAVFAYNNAGLSLAGHVVARLAGKTFESAVRDLVLRPLGLAHTFYFADGVVGCNAAAGHVMADGAPVPAPRGWGVPRSLNPAGGLISSARDQLRYATFHLGDGRGPDGRRLLAPSSVELMRSQPGPGGTLEVELAGMGVAWQLRPTAQGVTVVQHGGDVHGQHSGFLMVPERQFAMTLLTNSDSGAALIGELFTGDWALRLFAGLTNLPAPERRLPSAELAAYTGRYVSQAVTASGRLAGQPALTLTAHGGGLLAATGWRRAALTFYRSPFGPDYVVVKDAAGVPTGARADFIRDGAGRVRWLRLGGRLLQRQE